MGSTIDQRNATRNQSTADYGYDRIFIFDNKYQEAVFNNTTGASLDLEPGSLVLRNTDVAGQVKPAVAGATLVDVVGIVKGCEVITLADGATTNINYGIGGMVDESLLQLPSGVTLETVPTGAAKNLRDILTGLGFDLKAGVNNTKYDN